MRSPVLVVELTLTLQTSASNQNLAFRRSDRNATNSWLNFTNGL
ncbi:hypothetical protein [Nostoc sp. NMS9]|nr:hypothetical protein [Nostoc sp. NMS9]